MALLRRLILLFLFIPCLFSLLTYTSNNCNNTNECVKDNDCGCTTVCVSDCCPLFEHQGNVFGKTYFAGRGQHYNEPRRMMGVEDKIHLFGKDCFYAVGSVAIEYQQTLGGEFAQDLGKWFSMNGESAMTYGLDFNLNAEGDGTFNINALNFGVTSSGSIFFCPKKSDIIIDLDLFLGLESCLLRGLWGRIGMPIVHTRWDLNLVDNKTGTSSEFYPTDSVGASDIDVVFQDMETAFSADKGFGDAPALKKGKVSGRRTETGIAALRFDLGYEWFKKENWHLATSWDVILPTGNRPCAEFLFDPVIGESKRFEFGGTVNGAYRFWSNCDVTESLTIYADLTTNVLFASKQNRLLGLLIDSQPSPWSQYLLLKQFNAAGVAVGLERAANVLGKGDITVGAAFVADGAVMLEYVRLGLHVGLGYNIWGRTREEINQRCFGIPENKYGIKGGTQWNGVETTDTDSFNNSTASKSTISKDAAPDAVQKFISNEDIDYCAALHPSTFSNGLFAYASYNWDNNFALVGGQVEFGHDNRAFSYWGVIFKVGTGF